MTDTIDRSEDTEVLDRLVVRFAGDSGDGMQLTGDRFTSVERVVRQRPVDLSRLSRRDPGAAGHRQRRLGVPGPDLRPRHHHPRRRAERAGRHEPRRPQGRTAPSRSRRHAHRERGLVRRAQPREGRLRGQPARRRHGRELSGPSGADDVDHEGGLRRARREAARRRSIQELLRARSRLVDVHPPAKPTMDWIAEKFKTNDLVVAANQAAFKAGFAFGETTEAVGHRYEVRPAQMPPGEYTSISGNTALGLGPRRSRSARQAAGHARLVPDHPGERHPPRTLEAQALRGTHGPGRGRDRGRRRRARAPRSAVTSGSRPRAVPVWHSRARRSRSPIAIELPLLIIDIQRGGPSTGLPTKTEASDLNLAMYGRHGESPLPIVASHSPAQCFYAAIEAARIALEVPDTR